MSASAVGRLFHTAMVAVFTVALLGLSLIWSLGQTVDFTTYVFYGDELWGWVTGLLIQFGPQVFLLMATLSKGNKKIMWWGLFWLFSVFDAGTNIGARMNHIEVADSFVRNPLADVLGYCLDIVIVFAEEMVTYALGVLFYDIGLMLEYMGGDPPAWLAMGEDVAKSFSAPTNRRTRVDPLSSVTPPPSQSRTTKRNNPSGNGRRRKKSGT